MDRLWLQQYRFKSTNEEILRTGSANQSKLTKIEMTTLTDKQYAFGAKEKVRTFIYKSLW